MNKFILALCGLPASGKSTLADAIQKALDFEVEIVRTDEWRDETYYTDWKPEKEKPVRQAALDKVKNLVKDGQSVIHDDTNYYTSMRHELFKLAIENGYAFAIIHITTPVSTAIRWNNERVHSDFPDSVIEDIYERFDNPGRRYLWDNANLEVDMEKQEIDTVVPEIVQLLKELQPALEERPGVIVESEFNKVDTMTRRIVSGFLEEHPELRGRREVSTVRRSVLQEVHKGNLPIDRVSDNLIERLNELR
jgi:O-phosphoseryl-tRNA(Sec) kinase